MNHKSLNIPRFLWIIAATVLSVISFSCQNDEARFLYYGVQDPPAEVEINSGDESIRVTFSTDVTDAADVVAEFEVSEGATVETDGELQLSGSSAHNFEGPFSYLVTSEDGKLTVEWNVSPRNNDYTASWGLGGFQKESISNNREYEFYLDQGNTGRFSLVNCGPTVTTMAAHWYDRNFSGTPEDARQAYRPEGGWWYTGDINNYLTDNQVPHYFVELSSSPEGTENILRQKLRDGNLVILCLDMYYLSRSEEDEWRVDKFYRTDGTGWGHFLLVKGYKEVDGRDFIEVHDPYCFGKTYGDGTFKGRNRYYRAEEIATSVAIWWNYAIVIPPDALKASAGDAVPAAGIPQTRGR